MTYEEVLPLIDSLLEKKRSKWMLEAVRHYQYEDFSQEVRIHIYNQFDKWNQKRAFEPWCSQVIHNQMINKKRNLFSNHSKPCSDCFWDKGMGACGNTPSGLQCSECPFFAHWEKTKKPAYEMKIAGSVETEDGEIPIGDHGDVDYEGVIQKIGQRVKEEVDDDMSPITLVTYKIFCMTWIDKLDDDEIAHKMGYKSTEENRSPGYRNLSLHRKYAKDIAKEMFAKEDWDFL